MSNRLRKATKKVKEQKLLSIVNHTDIRSIFDILKNNRDIAIIQLLINTGLRVGELVGLKVGDVYTGSDIQNILVVRSEIAKGKKQRYIPLNNASQKAIQVFLNIHWNKYTHYNKDRYLIFSQKSNRISIRRVQEMIQSLAKQLNRNFSPHTFRHTFATNLLSKGANLKIIQDLLGHADISTTANIYLHNTIEDLRVEIDKLDFVKNV